MLVLPPHVHLHYRRGALRHGRLEHVEHLLLLGHVGMQRYRVRHDPLASEVADRREAGLAERALELGDVGAHLLPGPVGGEVAAEHVLERLADLAPVGAVPAAVGLPADAASQPHPAHRLEHRLVRYARAVHGPELHGYLSAAHAVGEPAEDLGDPRPQLGPGRRLGVGERVVVGRLRQRRRLEQVPQRESP